MDKLKQVLKRIAEDREDGIDRHPYLDPQESEKLDEKLRNIFNLKKNKKTEGAEGEEAEEAAEASEEEDGEKSLTIDERLIKATEEN